MQMLKLITVKLNIRVLPIAKYLSTAEAKFSLKCPILLTAVFYIAICIFK